MTTVKRFRSSPVVLDDPPVFIIDGLSLSGEPWEEEFTSRRAAPGIVLDLVAGSVSVARSGQMMLNQAQASPILRELICDDDLPRFERLIRDRDRNVDFATLWQVAMWLVEELTGRPTGGSGGSSAGPVTEPT
jgi:hypothetical protein